jgi:8-oxo-dGTP pyrophosphatase MutT (NUDIX family)
VVENPHVSLNAALPVVTVARLCQTSQSFGVAHGARVLGWRCGAAQDAWPLVSGRHRAPDGASEKSGGESHRQSKKAPPAIIALPKGAIDEGEKPDQTALREVEEETGLRAELISKLADIKYVYVRTWGDRARVFKIVSFYLLLYRAGKLGNIKPEMRIEVQRAFWIPLDKAPALLSYKGEKEVAEQSATVCRQPIRR